jgi:hypothetical protein
VSWFRAGLSRGNGLAYDVDLTSRGHADQLDLGLAFTFGVVSVLSSVALLGIAELLVRSSQSGDLWRFLMGWDGHFYEEIARTGYHWNSASAAQQDVNFFPLFPLLERSGQLVTRLPIHLVAIGANIILQGGATVALVLVVESSGGSRREAVLFAIFFLVTPTIVYDIMGYYSALFIFLLFLAALLELRGHLLGAAVAIGLLCATNPLGIAVAAALFLTSLIEAIEDRALRPLDLCRLVVRTAISLSGLAAFAAYLLVRFGDPIAFYQAAAAFSPPMPLLTEVERIVSFESIRHAVLSWAMMPYGRNTSFAIDAMSGLVVLVVIAVLLFERGAWKSFLFWLVVFSFLLVQLQSARQGTEVGTTRYLSPVVLLVGTNERLRRACTGRLAAAVILVVSLAGLAFFLQRLVTGQWID